MDACKHCSEPPFPGSQFCILHKCCKCYSGRQPHETGRRFQSRCAKCTKRNAVNASNYRKRQRDRLRQHVQTPTSAIPQLISVVPWSGAPSPVHHCMLGRHIPSQLTKTRHTSGPDWRHSAPFMCASTWGKILRYADARTKGSRHTA